MKIFYYCQHVLGIGHYLRSLEICKALEGNEVSLITGGPPIHTPLPPHIKVVRLPALRMDSDFKHLLSTDEGLSIEKIKRERRKSFMDLFEKEAPDLFVVELYPFGRNAFRFELEPILNGIRNGDLAPCFVACSLRDILVENEDQNFHEKRTLRSLNTHFDALLVHADPSLIRLDETFSRTGHIAIPVIYTGYVTPKSGPKEGDKLRRRLAIADDETLIVASAGGGNVGFRLLEAVIRALPEMKKGKSRHLHVFTGPLMSEKEFKQLQSLSNRRVNISRFTSDFLSYLDAASLSVSMAGYNTCVNLLASGVPALVWPFMQNREQRLRVEILERLEALKAIKDDDLQPVRLAEMMDKAMKGGARPRVKVDLDGAANTARWLQSWIDKERRV